MSKKTEKIEIRISEEDKLRVGELAAYEGKSMSEFVRSLVSRYVHLNTSRPNADRRLLGSAAAVAVLGLGAGAWLATQRPAPRAPATDLSAALKLTGGPLGDTRLRSMTLLKPGGTHNAFLPPETADPTPPAARYAVLLRADADRTKIDISICPDTGPCTQFDTPWPNGLSVVERTLPGGETATWALAPSTAE